jgi:glyoxylase-like metal-dependent hydrolase (beta-lactamase superfamily II)
MDVKIFQIMMGFDQCYLLQSDGVIMIDAGAPGKLNCFVEAMEKAQIPVHELRLVVLTHGHWDHVGCAKEIKEMTGAKIALHEREAPWLENSLTPLPPGVTVWGRLLASSLAKFIRPAHIQATNVDLKIGNEGFSLSEYGIPGKVIHTPGHSSGSISVLLESGEAFVGDMAMNRFPLRLKPGLPIFAEDASEVKDSWLRLLKEGVRTIYPAHGKPFSAEAIRKVLYKPHLI